ncbi:hypothetical protein G9C98_005977 [Cotesia typhae]|uniref:E3 ubiquitin-protein ligase Topors n=1 Tax=Cotesia typhae TaxID=2053667 RepID=A0A8J5QSP9_9HYME|nr:hypothetical protein G9C98_005977 [Cotesia typhae]
MENPINQEDPETNTKEPVKAEEPAASNSGERSDGTTSPPPNCSICLGKLINTSFTDSCLHQFCFTCLLQWSRIKTECPLCKQTFKSIIHNVRSEEDYDQYHVPRETHITTQALAFSSALSNASISAYQRFAYRTTMTPSRRYGRLYAGLQANSSHHTRQEAPPVSVSHPPPVSAQERRQRRNIYRTGEWRYPQEINRLIPWINRDLQTIFNPEQTPIAYVLDRITSLLQRYDMRSPEFRNEIRPLLQLETDHFIHELMNYASTDLTMAAYDDTVTYYNSFLTHGLSGLGYWHHVQSQTSSSTSSTVSDDSDIRVVDHVDPNGSEVPSVGPHLISLPGPSTVSQVLQLQTPEARPFVLTITSSSSESECEIVGYVKPRYRISLGSSESFSDSDSDFEESQSKKAANRRTSKHSTKVSKTSKSPRKSSGKKSDVSKKRSKHSYSSSDSPSPRESKCRRTSLNSSRKTTRAHISSSESDDDQSSSRNNDESKALDKDDKSKSKRSLKHKSTSERHNRSRSRSRSKSRSLSRSRSRSREELSDASEHYSVNERYRGRKAAKIANKRLKNKHLYAMTDSQNDEEAYRSNSQCSEISDRHKTSKSEKKHSNSKAKSHKKSHKKNSKKQKRVKTQGETEKRSRRRITSSSSSSSLSST